MMSRTLNLKIEENPCIKIFLLLFLSTSLWSQGSQASFLQDSIQKIITKNKIPGLQVAVVSKDSVLFKATYGYADLENKHPVSSKHLFKIGSITKSFTALAVMSLVNQGKLNLDDRLRDVVPDLNFENKWADSHPVLIKHLLEHKAGFDDMHFNTFGKERWDGINALDAAHVFKKSLKSRWQPGLVFSYSNPTYVVLGHIIEKVANMPYQDYISQYVISPLQMDATLFLSDLENDNPNALAKGYELKDEVHEQVKNQLSVGESAGAILSNLDDMIRFVQFFLNHDIQDHTLHLGHGTVKEMERPHSWFEEENNIRYGYGFGLDNIDTEVDGVFFTGHSGGVWGFFAHFLYSKEYDLGITIVNNGQTSNREIRNLLLSHYLKDSINLSDKTKEIPNSNITSDWDGHYFPINERNEMFKFINWPFNTIRLESKRDSLAIHYFLEGTEHFHSFQGNSFIKKTENLPMVYLTKTNGKKSLYYYGSYYHPVNGLALGVFKLTLAFALFGGLFMALISLIQFLGSYFKPSWKSISMFSFLVSLPSLLFIGSLILLVSNANLEGILKLGEINLLTSGIFGTTLLMPIASLFGLYYLIKNKGAIRSKALFVFLLLVVLTGLFLIGYCLLNDWVAMRTWVY